MNFKPTKSNQLVPKTLSPEFQEILNLLERDNISAFITGRAGTGKSTLLQLFKKVSKKRLAVLAPTGIAALNVGGQTIHSFFRLPPKMLNKSDITKRKNHNFYKKLETLIIDEISMVRADLLDNIDYFLRVNRGIDFPFGGVQVIFFGDLFQLPPVVSTPFEKNYFRTEYESPYFFSSKVLQQEMELPMIELNTVYRQKDVYFIKLLDRIRLRRMDMEDLNTLNERYNTPYEEDDMYITLTSINATAKRINEENLNRIINPAQVYTAKVEGKFKPSLFPTESNLFLKEDAQVMFVRNDIQKKFVNGTIGRIVETNPEWAKVLIVKPNGEEEIITVEQQEWEILNYEFDPQNPTKFKTKVVGSFTQIPLKLAWAITIHKSQGKTFDFVKIDLGRGAFEYGQSYVALSRCRTLEGIVLVQAIKPKDILVDERIVEFYEMQRRY